MSLLSRRGPAAAPLGSTHSSVLDEHTVATGTGRPGLWQRIARRALEGGHPWGELDVWTSRYGYTSYCLVVYPPGATRTDRIRFRLMRAWPPIGMLLGIFTVIVVGQTQPLIGALAAGAAVFAIGALGSARIAGAAGRRIRTLQTCQGDAGTSALDRGPQDALDALRAALFDAEQEWRAGRIDAVRFEAVWSEVWSDLGDAALTRP